MKTWTRGDERHALLQGWGIFVVDSGQTRIQKMDDPPAHWLWQEGDLEKSPFESDAAAIRFVRQKAREGDATCLKAIALHDNT